MGSIFFSSSIILRRVFPILEVNVENWKKFSPLYRKQKKYMAVYPNALRLVCPDRAQLQGSS